MTWTLSYELIGGTDNTGHYAVFVNVFNGVGLPNSSSHLDEGAGLWKEYTADVTSIFNPAINNALYTGYAGTSGLIRDYGRIRKLKVQGSNGDVYYGEYPSGFSYTKQQYDSGQYGTWEYQAGDGDYPPRQWDQQAQKMIETPIGPDGTPSFDRCWFYFTVVAPDPVPEVEVPRVQIGQPLVQTRVNFMRGRI